MASVHKTQYGTFEVRFTVGKSRRSYYPGPKTRTEKQAEDIGLMLDRLSDSVENDGTPPKFVESWLQALPDRKHDKLADWGLVTRRANGTPSKTYPLAQWLREYIERGGRDEATNMQLRRVRENLLACFDAGRCIKTIGKADAEDFRVYLETRARQVGKDEPSRGLAKNTVRRRVGRAREFFNLAVRRGIITENPFADEKVSVGTDPARQFFVPAEWIELCITAANCEDWRIMLAFARYAGMRSHETRLQRWEDIDIPNRRMIVRSNKTPPTRVCPIFPELLPHLMRARELGSQGESVVTRYTTDASLNEAFKKIVRRAGLTMWPKPLQNLRATRETELIALYPIKDVASWLGNSAPIAMKHYAMAMKSSFEQAIVMGANVELKNPPQKPPHSTAINSNQQQPGDALPDKETPENVGFPAVASCCGPDPMPRAGLEPA